MQGSVKALVLIVSLGLTSCSNQYIYGDSECKVLEKREDGKVVLECYDKTLRKKSRLEPKEPREPMGVRPE